MDKVQSVYNAAGEIVDVFEIMRVLDQPESEEEYGNAVLHRTRAFLDADTLGECMHGGELQLRVEMDGTDGKTYTVYAWVAAILSDEDAV